MIKNIIKYFLENKLVAWLLLGLFVVWQWVTAPFDILAKWLAHDPVRVDATPNTGLRIEYQLLVAQNEILRLQLNAAYSQLEMGLAKAGIKQLINY